MNETSAWGPRQGKSKTGHSGVLAAQNRAPGLLTVVEVAHSVLRANLPLVRASGSLSACTVSSCLHLTNSDVPVNG